LIISPSVLGPTTVNVPYIHTLTATGGTGTYTWSVSSGALPTGITLNPTTGMLSGFPTVAGVFTFTVDVTDNNVPPGFGQQPYTWTINGPVSVLPAALGTMQQTVAFSESVSASGGTSPYIYTVTAGTLPAGLTLNASTGLISGTPTVSGPYNFTITATDFVGAQGSTPYSGIVAGPTIDVITSTNFVTTPVIVPGSGFGFNNIGTGMGSLYLQFVQSNNNPQSVEVTCNNTSAQVILVNVNSINYSVNPGVNFAQVFVVPYLGLITISSLVPALYTASSVTGTVYVAASENCLYRLRLTPTVRAVEGDEGSLDTSVYNGRSQQRTGYITITENYTQVKVMEMGDGECINTQIQQLPDVIPLVTDGYPQG